MKAQFNFSLFIFLLFALTVGAFSSARAKKTRSAEGSIKLSKQIDHLEFNSTSADFIVKTHNRPEVFYAISVTRDKWSGGDSLLTNQMITVEESDGSQIITFTQPFVNNNGNYDNRKEMSWIKALLKGNSSENNISVHNQTTTIRLTIPENLPVSFSSDYGYIELRDLKADLSLEGSSTDLTLSSVVGNIAIENSYGDVELNEIQGNVDIKNQSSDIEIVSLKGNLTINTGYSDIELLEVTGKIYIDNRSGELICSEIHGDMELLADYTDVEIKNAEGDITSSVRSGELIIQDLRGGLTHEGDYTDVELKTISGYEAVSLEGRSSEFKLFEISNPVEISGEYLDISGNQLSGGFSSDSKSTDINLSELAGTISLSGNNDIRLTKIASKHITITNSRDNIELSLKEHLPEMIDITTKSGDVTLDLSDIKNLSANFDLNVTNGRLINENQNIDGGKIDEKNDRQIFKTIAGDGNAEVTISIRNGTLRIQ